MRLEVSTINYLAIILAILKNISKMKMDISVYSLYSIINH